MTARIKDNPSTKELRESIEGAVAIKALLDFAGKFGLKSDRLNELLKQVPELAERGKRLFELPDRFNDLLGDRGWIAHESLEPSIMERAIQLAEAGDLEEADRYLSEYYDAARIDLILRSLRWREKFAPRWELAQAAKADYVEGRYLSCVPLILMLIDGYVNDLLQIGFFAEKADLSAFDSIAGHETGLKRLAKVFSASRNKTMSEAITIPYRNGILHGRDLNYGNKTVAAKAWAALATIADWEKARNSAEDKTGTEKKPESIIASLRKIAENRRKHEAVMKKMAQWKPREIVIGKTFPATGEPEAFLEGFPERTIASFFSFWRSGNFGGMADLLLDWGETINKRAGELARDLRGLKFREFTYVSITRQAPAWFEAKVLLKVIEDALAQELELDFTLRYEKNSDELATYPGDRGRWAIMDRSIYRLRVRPIVLTKPTKPHAEEPL